MKFHNHSYTSFLVHLGLQYFVNRGIFYHKECSTSNTKSWNDFQAFILLHLYNSGIFKIDNLVIFSIILNVPLKTIQPNLSSQFVTMNFWKLSKWHLPPIIQIQSWLKLPFEKTCENKVGSSCHRSKCTIKMLNNPMTNGSLVPLSWVKQVNVAS